jgi:glucan phosphoethanolaminetransferase (alkaline phosphatase superfamily)
MQKWGRITGDVLNEIYPAISGVFLFFGARHFRIDYSLRGFGDVLASIITFSSIVIGFYTAMYGILLTVNGSAFMDEFRKRKVAGIFKFQLYDSLVVSFLVLFLSILLQVLRHYPNRLTDIVSGFWYLTVGYFIATSYRAITLLLRLLFLQKKEVPRYSEKTEEEKKQQFERINGNDKKR